MLWNIVFFTLSVASISSAQMANIDNLQSLAENVDPVYLSWYTNLNWTRYYTFEEISEWLYSLRYVHKNNVTVINIYRSDEGRVIRGVKLSFGAAKKPGVFIEGGIHGREWISPATVTYLIKELLTSKRPEVRELAEAHDWYIFPIFNPDGYVYTHHQDRMWQKTRSIFKNTSCMGIDLNHNWGYNWTQSGGGASSNPCDETYAGPRVFSARETIGMSNYTQSIAHQLISYIAFRSYGQVLAFPYGYTSQVILDNYEQEKAIASKAVEALGKRYGTIYKYGTIFDTEGQTNGCSLDWVKATLKVPLTFQYKLRDQGKHGYVLPAEQIIPNSEEVLDSLIALFAQAATMGITAN